MARKRRGRKKKITYDSGETKVVLGLIAIFVAVIALLSNFTEGIAFEYIHNLFGGATWLVAFAFLVLSLKLFNVKPDRITKRSVLGAFLIAFAYAVYLTGGTDLPVNIKILSYTGGYGGIVGYEIANWLGSLLTQDMIRPLCVITIFLAIPLLLSLSYGEYFGYIKAGFSKIFEFLGGIKDSVKRDPKENDEEGEDEEIDFEYEQAQMMGDFREEQEALLSEKPKNSVLKDVEAQKKKALENVKFTADKDKNGDILMQDEIKYPDWKLPPITLLKKVPKVKPSMAGIKKNSQIIERTLESFGIQTKVVDVLIGPSITQYALDIALGTKVSKIANLRNDLALALATSANAVRIEAPIPGTRYIGIEVPNKDREMVSFREMMEGSNINSGHLTATIGKNVSGDKINGDIQKMPHLLIAGATGSGKSVVTNAFIMSLLMKKSPDEVRFILVDPKQVEFSDYNGIPHLLTPVITEMDKVNNALKWAILEMEHRYTEFKNYSVRNIEGFNEKMGYTALPYIVIVIDEMADMMMTQHGAEIESSIVKLAQKARATGIHLILATQRPSVDVITGLIKANIPGRIGMSVTTQIDSRVILDQVGAEALLGQGDMLYKDPSQSRLSRIQGGFVSQKEVLDVVKFVKDQSPEVEYSLEVTKTQPDPNAPAGAAESLAFSEDDLFISAMRVVVNAKKGSSSLIQRKLSVGYNRAARLLDELEENGVVGPPNGSKPRDVLITDVDGFLARGQGDLPE